MAMKFLQPDAPGKATVPPPFELSPVKRTHGWWMYLWPFQSRQERVIMLSVLAVGLLLISLIVWLFLDHDALPWTLAGGFIGGVYGGPYRSLPGEVAITTRSEARHHLADLKKLVERIGYIPSDKTTAPGHFHYVGRMPKNAFLRLIAVTGEGMDLNLRVDEHTIEVRSQFRWVHWIHWQLTKQLEA